MENYKPARRKTWALFSALFICAVSAFRFQMDWPLACLIGFIFAVFVSAILILLYSDIFFAVLKKYFLQSCFFSYIR
jgi:hypothetical protein